MKAMTYARYGPPDVFELREVPKPIPRADEILVKVRAGTVTAADWRMRKADPFAARIFNGLLRPRHVRILGFEVAGQIEAVGKGVTKFRKGDSVFGHNDFRFGAYAEYVCLRQGGMLAVKPTSLSFEECAAVSFGGLAALNHLRKGGIRAGHKVLIYGASGSAGTYAVQLAKHFGAEVTAVCSTANLDWVRALGAARVIDYTVQDVRAEPGRYDLIYDAVGRMISALSARDFAKMLGPGGVFVSVEMNRKDKPEDLAYLAQLMDGGHLKAVIDRQYPLEELAEAHRYVDKGHKKGNVVIAVRASDSW